MNFDLHAPVDVHVRAMRTVDESYIACLRHRFIVYVAKGEFYIYIYILNLEPMGGLEHPEPPPGYATDIDTCNINVPILCLN